MKLSRLIFVGAVCVLMLVLLPLHYARGQDYIEYKMQINLDSSADWTITKVSDINATIDVEGFFSQLYGDGAIRIIYPSEYSIQSVSPVPNERDDSGQTLGWFRTQDFINGEPNVTLKNNPPTSVDVGSQLYIIVGLIS